MNRHLTYIMFETILLLAYFLLAANLYVYASDAPSIAFSSNRDGDYDIYIMDIKGKNLQNLTNSPTHEFKPAFSPDGQRMAYVSNRDGNEDIYVMNLNTKVSYRLTNHPGHDDNPAWSPDGRWIAFDSYREATYDIYKIEPDGENLQRLTHGEGDKNFTAAWSPNGQSIVFFLPERFLVSTSWMPMAEIRDASQTNRDGDTCPHGRRMENRSLLVI